MPKYEKLYKHGSVWSSIFKLAIPALVIILLMIFYNMADMIFIGRLGDSAMVASISIVSPLFSLLMAVATMIGFGGSTLMTNALGAENQEEVRNVSSVSFWSALLFGLAIIPVLLAVRNPLLFLLGASEETIAYASSYYTILLFGAPFMILSTSLASLIRADGSIKESMIGNVSGTITNLILDPIFIFRFGMGVAGAAAATVLGNAVATILYFYFIRRGTTISLRPANALKKPLLALTVLALGLPNAVSTILSGFASSFSNNLLKTYGTDAIASMAAAGKVSMIIAMIILGITMGTQPLLAYAYGAKDHGRMREIIKDLLILTTGLGLVGAVFSYTLRNNIIHLFLTDQTAAGLAESMVLFLIAGAPLMGVVNISTNLMQASKNAAGAIVLSVLRQGVLLIAFLYLFETLFGLTGIAMAHTAADLISAAIAIGLLLWQMKQNAPKVRSSVNSTCNALPANG